jgi:3-dehydroquinate synthase
MSNKTIHMPLPGRAYDIVIGEGFYARRACEDVVPIAAGRACFIVSDSNVAPLYLESAKALLLAVGAASVASTTFSAGEESKNLQTLSQLYSDGVAAGMDRKSLVVALGGGVVGDTAGFFAASYMRGVEFVQMSTSLVAHVDSSIGGKTGVDLPEGKNLVGAFHQPKLVMVDVQSLRTLDQRQLRCGLAEVVKYGVILDAEFFAFLEGEGAKLLDIEGPTYSRIVGRCCELKAQVVLEDELDFGLRAILNYGHTFGHALEKLAGYATFTHGEAIAIGMGMAAELALILDPTAARQDLLRRQDALLGAIGLPLRCAEYAAEAILQAMSSDKKYEKGKNRLIVPDGVGAVHVQADVDEDAILAAIRCRCD